MYVGPVLESWFPFFDRIPTTGSQLQLPQKSFNSSGSRLFHALLNYKNLNTQLSSKKGITIGSKCVNIEILLEIENVFCSLQGGF